jgi:hypothetical protein
MTLGGYWPPSSKVEIADFWGGRIVRGDVFFASIFFNFFMCTWNQNFFLAFLGGKFSSAAPTAELGTAGGVATTRGEHGDGNVEALAVRATDC